MEMRGEGGEEREGGEGNERRNEGRIVSEERLQEGE